ncbi:MAG: hypothetical protein Q4D06_07640 [Coriobacteriia bacterium]|nr:hypothetical protein [Coriobacteriia bacterium]
MKCSKCGFDGNGAGSKFCCECGASLGSGVGNVEPFVPAASPGFEGDAGAGASGGAGAAGAAGAGASGAGSGAAGGAGGAGAAGTFDLGAILSNAAAAATAAAAEVREKAAAEAAVAREYAAEHSGEARDAAVGAAEEFGRKAAAVAEDATQRAAAAAEEAREAAREAVAARKAKSSPLEYVPPDPDAPAPKKGFPVGKVIAGVVALAVVAGAAGTVGAHRMLSGGTDVSPAAIVEPVQEYALDMEMSCLSNLFFSTYDVEVYVDDRLVGTVTHGSDNEFHEIVEAGQHTLELRKEGSSSVSGTRNFVTEEGDSVLRCEFACKSEQVAIREFEVVAAGEGAGAIAGSEAGAGAELGDGDGAGEDPVAEAPVEEEPPAQKVLTVGTRDSSMTGEPISLTATGSDGAQTELEGTVGGEVDLSSLSPDTYTISLSDECELGDGAYSCKSVEVDTTGGEDAQFKTTVYPLVALAVAWPDKLKSAPVVIKGTTKAGKSYSKTVTAYKGKDNYTALPAGDYTVQVSGSYLKEKGLGLRAKAQEVHFAGTAPEKVKLAVSKVKTAAAGAAAGAAAAAASGAGESTGSGSGSTGSGSAAKPKVEERTVYITPTGTKYHSQWCKTIKNSCSPMTESKAQSLGYQACKVCGG